MGRGTLPRMQFNDERHTEGGGPGVALQGENKRRLH